jgi:hypothetical protein
VVRWRSLHTPLPLPLSFLLSLLLRGAALTAAMPSPREGAAAAGADLVGERKRWRRQDAGAFRRGRQQVQQQLGGGQRLRAGPGLRGAHHHRPVAMTNARGCWTKGYNEYIHAELRGQGEA